MPIQNSPYGALKTLFTMLGHAPELQGVSLVFGEENIIAQEWPLPMVVMAPVGGPWIQPGYSVHGPADGLGLGVTGTDPWIWNTWQTQEDIDLYLWGFNNDANATAIDHADATEDLRARVLQAFQNAQAGSNDDGIPADGSGLMYRPISGRWQYFGEGNNRYGRAYVLRINVDITVVDIPIVEGIITKETITATLSVPIGG